MMPEKSVVESVANLGRSTEHEERTEESKKPPFSARRRRLTVTDRIKDMEDEVNKKPDK